MRACRIICRRTRTFVIGLFTVGRYPPLNHLCSRAIGGRPRGDTVAMDELAPELRELRELYTNPEQTITTARHVLQSYREGSDQQDRSAASRVFNWTMGNYGIGRDTQRQKRKRVAFTPKKILVTPISA